MASPKRRRRRSASGILIVVALAAIAVVAGCTLLRPTHQVGSHRATAAPSRAPSTAGATTAPTETATPIASSEPPAFAASEEPTASPTGPRLALIIDDCGQWLDTERAFIALPIPLTLSVLPDVRYNAIIAQEANAAGKGVMLHLPMETVSGLDPGPGKVTTEMSDAQIDAQVVHDLAQVPLAEGVNNHEGSRGSADRRVMGDVVDTIVKRGDLFFIDSKTASNSVAQDVAARAGLATASRDVFLDNQDDVTYVEAQLRVAADLAVKNGSAIAIGHPRSATLEAVRALYPEFQKRGIVFVLARDLTTRP